MGIQMDEDERVLDFVKERVEAADGTSMAEAPQEAMKLLKRFEFQRDRWNERLVPLALKDEKNTKTFHYCIRLYSHNIFTLTHIPYVDIILVSNHTVGSACSQEGKKDVFNF